MAKPLPISDSFDLGRVFTNKFQRRDAGISPLKPVFGLDTETWKGDIFLLADSSERFIDDISAKSVIDFLFHKKYQSGWNFFYNLGYDAEVILKLLDQELEVYKKTNILEFRFNDYRLSYIPDKILRISKGHHSVVFYDIGQYFHASLPVAYEKNIKIPLPESYKEFKSKRSEFTPRFYARNKNKVRNYCITDCKLTRELAEYWIKHFHDAFSIYCKKWISSGYLAEKVLINNGIEIPKFNSIPYEIQKLAWAVVDHGGRFEITKRGFIGTAHLYDINSAYPSAIARIPDLTKGKWVKSKSIHPKAELGFFRIIADIPDDKHVAPFPFKKANRIFFPTGKFETIVTLHELRACESPKYYQILESYQFVPSGSVYPYQKYIESLYLKRLELKQKNDPLQLPIKIILNSIYGKTGQKSGGIGNLFNPVIFVSITGMIRGLLYDFVIRNNLEKDIIAFATDSILTKRKLELQSNKIGEFSFVKSADDTFILQNGYNRMNGEWKNRGIASMGGKTLNHLDTFVKDGKLYLKLEELRNTRLRSGIVLGRIHDIGHLQIKIRQIDPNADNKRFWLGTITNIDDKICNDSIPFSMNYFKKEEI
jgi:hypothetical protein